MRRSIALLAIAGLLPIVVLGASFAVVTLDNQRAALTGRIESHARFAALLVSRGLADDLRAARMLAQSPALDEPIDQPRFELLARRLLAETPEWRAISIANLDGTRHINVTRAAAGAPPGRVIDAVSMHRAAESRRGVIGRIIRSPRKGFVFAVRAPVVRDGKVRLVASVILPSAAMQPLLLPQALPAGSTITLIDGDGRVVAATGPGAPAAGSRFADANAGTDGAQDDVRTVRAAVPGTPWWISIATPTRVYAEPARQAAMVLTIAAVLGIVLFLLMARLLVFEMRQYRAREAAALQSQRMEALGRLTGGVAHDFNNLLTPIVGNLDLLRRNARGDPRTLRQVDAALASAERARTLVGRLLAFSRRQTLAPRDIDVAQLIDGLSDLLVRSVGPDVRLDVAVAPGLGPVHADSGQLELAILNLAINARDAMPGGGTITIRAEERAVETGGEIAPGRYIRICVADTGTGMDEATLRQAIDPFFTTKGPEKGTGLGLSMVHGFAAQSGGRLVLQSAPGEGTTVEIWLPVGAGPAVDEAPARIAAAPRTGALLLVDDDAQARRTTAEILREHGYRVTEAGSADEAIDLLGHSPRFAAVITDYAMPEKSGGQLIQHLRRIDPGFPILLVTGFIDTAADVPADVARLDKPYRAQELIEALGRILGGEPG